MSTRLWVTPCWRVLLYSILCHESTPLTLTKIKEYYTSIGLLDFYVVLIIIKPKSNKLMSTVTTGNPPPLASPTRPIRGISLDAFKIDIFQSLSTYDIPIQIIHDSLGWDETLPFNIFIGTCTPRISTTMPDSALIL